jgi:hypothetical protein
VRASRRPERYTSWRASDSSIDGLNALTSRRARERRLPIVQQAAAQLGTAVGSDHSLKEVSARRAVKPAGLQAAAFESGGPSRTGTDRCVRASRRGPCRRGRRGALDAPASRTGSGGCIRVACSSARNQSSTSSYRFAITHLLWFRWGRRRAQSALVLVEGDEAAVGARISCGTSGPVRVSPGAPGRNGASTWKRATSRTGGVQPPRWLRSDVASL